MSPDKKFFKAPLRTSFLWGLLILLIAAPLVEIFPRLYGDNFCAWFASHDTNCGFLQEIRVAYDNLLVLSVFTFGLAFIIPLVIASLVVWFVWSLILWRRR